MALLSRLIRQEELGQLTAGEIDALSSRLDGEIAKLVQRPDVQQHLANKMRRDAGQLRRGRRQRAQGGAAETEELQLNLQDDKGEI